MSADGKHYYLMDHLRIKYFELTIPYNISSAQYVSTHTFSVTSKIAKSGSPYRTDFIHPVLIRQCQSLTRDGKWRGTYICIVFGILI